MTEQTTTSDRAMFAVEEAKEPRNGYKKVHKAGCRDLRDPLPFTCAPTLAALRDVTEGYAVDALDDAEMRGYLSPCAKKMLTRDAWPLVLE